MGYDGSGCVVGPKGFRNGPTGSTNGPAEEAMSLKDIDDAAGVEGCHYSNEWLIESPNLVKHEKYFKHLKSIVLPSSFLTFSSSSDSCTSLSASPYNNKYDKSC